MNNEQAALFSLQEDAMEAMTLYSGPLSMFGAKAQIAILEKNLPFHLIMVPFTTDHRYDPKHPEVLRINPKRQVPVLVHESVEIFDSTQIFEYLEHLCPSPRLWPQAPATRACARLLEMKSDEVFFPHIIRLMGLQHNLGDSAALDAIAQAQRYYSDMDRLLANAPYLAGDYSYADIAFFMAQLFAARLGAPMTTKTPRLLDWRSRVAARAAVVPIVAQFVETIEQMGRPVPDFMRAAIAGRTKGT
jgi:glutathione S-transferase